MRIIAGKAKGRRLKAPKGEATRPTTDRVKESLFAILGDITESRWLDLYGGSGAISLEAISRGAKEAVLIESGREALKIIAENVALTGFSAQCTYYKNTAQKAVDMLCAKGAVFDYIFLDPPYASQEVAHLLSKKELLKCLSKEGIVILEQGHAFTGAQDFEVIDQRKYGDTYLTFLRCKDEDCISRDI